MAKRSVGAGLGLGFALVICGAAQILVLAIASPLAALATGQPLIIGTSLVVAAGGIVIVVKCQRMTAPFRIDTMSEHGHPPGDTAAMC